MKIDPDASYCVAVYRHPKKRDINTMGIVLDHCEEGVFLLVMENATMNIHRIRTADARIEGFMKGKTLLDNNRADISSN